MSRHSPHKQLKAIRKQLHITQMRAAELLSVSYPYFLSIETGQRKLSEPLADKITKTFGVVNIGDKNAEPLIRDPDRKAFVPFTNERYLAYTLKTPSFLVEDGQEIVTPTLDDYARCAHALLRAAAKQQKLRPVLLDFFRWFQESNDSDAMFDSLQRSFDQLFPGERRKSKAFLALTANWEDAAFAAAEAAAARRAADRERKRKKRS